MKHFKLYSLLLMLLFASISNVWATTVKYTVNTATSVTTTGTAPTSSSTTLSGGSLNSGFIQCTNGVSSTFTLSGYAGYKITGIKINVHSNKSSGTGSFSVVAGSTTIASIAESAFNSTAWNGGWSQTGVDKTLTMTNNSYEIKKNEDVTFTISCKSGGKSYNSLYISSWEITYEAVPTEPTISLDPKVLDWGKVKLGAEVEDKTFTISATNLTQGGVAIDYDDAAGYETDETWLAATDGVVSSTTITVTPHATNVAGVYNGTINVGGTTDFDPDSTVSVKMTVLNKSAVTIVTPTGGTLSVLKGETPVASATEIDEEDALTITAEAGENYTGGTIKVVKTSDESDVTSDVLSGSTLTMPAYAITISASFDRLYAVAVPEITGGSLTWNGGEAPAKVTAGTTATLVATPTDPYTGGSIQILKAEDDSDVTEAVLSGSTLTMPAYAIKIIVTFDAPTCTELDAPTLDAVTKDYKSATIAWKAVTNADGYVLNVTKHSDASAVVTDEIIVAPAVSFEIASGLDANTQYDYTVMAMGDGTTYCASSTKLLEGNFTTEDYPAATLTLSENGAAHAFAGSHKLYDVVELPSAVQEGNEVAGKVLVGWDANAECATAPTYAKGAEFQLTATAQTLYAVYAIETPGEDINTDLNYSNLNLSTSYSTQTKTVSGVTYTINQGYKGTNNCVQMNSSKGEGVLYNTTALTNPKSITLYTTSAGKTATIYKGKSSKPLATVAGTAACEESKTYTINIDSAYFTLQVSGATYFEKIRVTTTGTPSYSEYATTGAKAPVETPEFSVPAGNYNVAQSVELSCKTAGATIYYTTNGDDPTSSSTEYTEAISVSQNTTIKAIGIKEGFPNSEIASATYTFQCATPSITTDAAFLDDINVSIACETAGVTIYYTTDGEDPTTASDVYSASIKLSATTTVKALAVKAGWDNSAIANETFTKLTVYTVAEAIAEIDKDKTKTISGVVVEGYVVADVTRTSSTAGVISYYIKDVDANGFLTGTQFQAYNGKNLGNVNFNKNEGVEIGAKVRIYGNIKYYTSGSVYELDANNYLLSYDAGTFAGVVVYGTPDKTEYEAGEDFEFDGLNAKDTWDNGYAQALTFADLDWTADPETVSASGTIKVKASYEYNEETYASEWYNVAVTVNTHKVTVAASAHGTVAVQKQVGENWVAIAENEEFVKGTKLKVVVVSADKDYRLTALTANEEDIFEVEDKSFFIGSEDVTVSATFGLTTGVDNIENGEKAVKVMKNGVLYIIRGEKTYTITGELIR